MRADGARIVFVPMRRSPAAPQNVLAVARVHRLIRRERPAVVHGHSSIGGVVAHAAALRHRRARGLHTQRAVPEPVGRSRSSARSAGSRGS